jgi:hypothetical protein
MNHRSATSTLAALLLASAQLPAHADTLFTVPIAGTLEPRRLGVVFEQDSGSSLNSDNTSRFLAASYDWSRYLSLGAVARLTDGVSIRPEGSVQFAPIGKPYAFAAGFANVGVRTFRSQPYATAATHFDHLGAYFGLTHDTFGVHAMLGADYALTREWSLQADWIGDDGNFLTVGARWKVMPDFALGAGFSRANSHDSGNGVFFSIDKDFRL